MLTDLTTWVILEVSPLIRSGIAMRVSQPATGDIFICRPLRWPPVCAPNDLSHGRSTAPHTPCWIGVTRDILGHLAGTRAAIRLFPAPFIATR